MKITICGSSAFREKKVQIMDELIKLGHEPIIHPHYIESVKKGRRDIIDRINKGEHAQLKIENDYIKWYYNSIVESEAILVLNLNKNGKENYIGGNVLMEMGFAYVHGKKIYLYNPIPEYSPYVDEILATYDEVIDGDLTKLK